MDFVRLCATFALDEGAVPTYQHVMTPTKDLLRQSEDTFHRVVEDLIGAGPQHFAARNALDEAAMDVAVAYMEDAFQRGIQAGAQIMLDLLGKRPTAEQETAQERAQRALEACKQTGKGRTCTA